MLEGNRCELCKQVVHGTRAGHKQTKYCEECAKTRKKENTLNPWLPEEKKEYMRKYMRAYRKAHPRLSSPYVRKYREKGREKQVEGTVVRQSPTSLRSIAWFLPLLCIVNLSSETLDFSFDIVKTVIAYLELLVVKITSLEAISKIVVLNFEHGTTRRINRRAMGFARTAI